MTVSPEVMAEQVMGYVVGASELIPTLQPPPNKSYSIAILPQGPHFYTGLLQAAGYLLLDASKKNLMIISQQSDDPKTILVDSTSYGPIFGQSWENSIAKTNALAKSIGGKITAPEQKNLFEQMLFQLPFLRVVTNTESIHHVSIGNNTPVVSIKKLMLWIKKNMSKYNIVLLTNIDIIGSVRSKKNDEEKQIAKLIQDPLSNITILTLFQNILKLDKKKPEVIAYVNPGDFGKTGSLTTRYVCAVA
ncbi:MAG: hypothetical protein NTY80_00135 [candidate division SR1 bacterium]|nr:hypothetical protein [candidate division SR1 bacterium]